jgi:CTP:molybdopterin cytidylyltransferase MocA
MSVAAIVLAAGASHRLGEPKQLVRLGAETLIERSVRICKEAGCSPVVAVLGAFADRIVSQIPLWNAAVVLNEEWAEGMASSIRAGVRSLPSDVEGCLVLACDMPAVTAEHLLRLIGTGGLSSSAYAGRRGIPAFFPATFFPELLSLHGDTGARALLLAAQAVELPGGEHDVDTAQDIEHVRAMFS